MNVSLEILSAHFFSSLLPFFLSWLSISKDNQRPAREGLLAGYSTVLGPLSNLNSLELMHFV